MFYIIGPQTSAEAMARKNGLRKGEWKHVRSLDDVRGRSFTEGLDLVLSTHDMGLTHVEGVIEYIKSHTKAAT